MNDEVIRRVIYEAYMKVLEKGDTPSVAMVERTLKDLIERNAYELIYADVNFKNISEEEIHKTLMALRCYHTYFGNLHFDAQNVIFRNLVHPAILLLKDGNNEK